MKIKVTQKHIDNGIIECNDRCPIALAIFDEGFHCVDVEPNYVYLVERKSGKAHIIDLPKNAQDFIQNFDMEKQVEPFDFELIFGVQPKSVY